MIFGWVLLHNRVLKKLITLCVCVCVYACDVCLLVYFTQVIPGKCRNLDMFSLEMNPLVSSL